MSGQQRSPTVGGTLAGGIQDVSAILPIIGTAQCESHVGSALRGGYLYAAAAPLSIFGSLGIVKAGVTVLISSISISRFWVSPRDLRPSGPDAKAKQSMFFGARMLEDAGFKLQGDVAALIGMDGTRFKAETKLIQILEEKHIDNPKKVRIKWKSKQWNTMLVVFTFIAAAISGVPYFALLLGPESWRPTTHLPWLFPFLRTVGSCLASVCCQFIIQSRVISAMKNRILFMAIHRRITDHLSTDNKVNLDNWLKYHLQWDADLPAEQCIRNLQQALSFYDDISKIGDDVHPPEGHVSIDMPPKKPPQTQWSHWRYRRSSTPQHHPPPPKPLFKTDYVLRDWHLLHLMHKMFISPVRNRVFPPISWIVLCLSLPATVAGYVGCFTLVAATPSPGNGPLVWLGLEAALSIIRILIWAWNPKFDEDTDVTVVLKLDNNQPFPATEEVETFINHLKKEKTKPLVLLPERKFLEGMTAFCGPLDQFRTSENIVLYFTIMADNTIKEVGSRCLSLLITVFDLNTRVGVTILQFEGLFYYFDAGVKYEAGFSEVYGNVQSTMRNIHSWQTQVGILFSSLEEYYNSLVHCLNRTNNKAGNKWETAELKWKWDLDHLSPKLSTTSVPLPSSPDHGLLSPDERYEHGLKTKLVGVWSRWIIENMKYRTDDARNDCYKALADETSEKARWELTELDRIVALEWTRRELALLLASIALEEILRFKMEKYIPNISGEQKEGKWTVGFELGYWHRLENEKREMKERMKKAMKESGDRAERERRSWKEQERFAPKWQEGIKLIEELWSDVISRGPPALESAESKVDYLAGIDIPSYAEDMTRDDFVGQVRNRFAHWDSQRENERREMEATIEHIHSVGDQSAQLDIAYKYPEPDSQAFKFARLPFSTSKGKACSAIVYDAPKCSAEAVCDAIKKSTTRSVIHVDPKIVDSIPPNDHLLFLTRQDGGEEPAFVQSNRDRWWDQQTRNSALFYFTPQAVLSDSCCVFSGPIAQIFIFLATPSRVRLRLLHRAKSDILVSILENSKNLCTHSDGIPKGNFKLQVLELGGFTQGKHELQVVVSRVPRYDWNDPYQLRDVLIEFLDNPLDSDHTHKVRPIIGVP